MPIFCMPPLKIAFVGVKQGRVRFKDSNGIDNDFFGKIGGIFSGLSLHHLSKGLKRRQL